MPCITTAVEFEDESLGDIISWNWSFEGGTPATSAVQNPVITYNTQGQYDVQLIVYDGEVYDTLLNPEYILVITAPVQPNTPTGPTSICQDQTGIQYSIPVVQYATTYVWDVEPNNAGTISGPDPVATFTPALGYTGAYTIKARADNNCGTGTWSQELSCETFLTPSEFTLSESAGYCEGGDGVQILLDGSETGVNYELFLDGDATGQILAGTGNALDFGYKTETGIYTCNAFTDQCENEMIGNTYIWVINAPAEPETPTGSTQECSTNTDVIYTTEDVTGATGYVWTLTPAEAGTISGDTEEASVNWSPDFSGTANIHVAAINACATGPASDNLTVTVYATPQPAVSGDQTVCDWEPGLIYNTPLAEGNTYTWEIMNGHITGGDGSNEITVTWHDPGTGWVKVTETNNDCVVTTENFEITIEDCVGLGEEEIKGFSLYPNPVKDELVIRFNGKNTDRNLVIMNQLGKVVFSEMLAGEEQVIINTSELASGIYYIRVTEQGNVTDKKFIKVD
jgi:PKD repeat protein